MKVVYAWLWAHKTNLETTFFLAEKADRLNNDVKCILSHFFQVIGAVKYFVLKCQTAAFSVGALFQWNEISIENIHSPGSIFNCFLTAILMNISN